MIGKTYNLQSTPLKWTLGWTSMDGLEVQHTFTSQSNILEGRIWKWKMNQW